jgi:hypothetical protein
MCGMAQIRFHNGAIDLHVLPPVAAINGARIRELTGDETFSEATEIILRVFKAVVGERTFHVGSALAMEKHSAPLELPSWSAWR